MNTVNQILGTKPNQVFHVTPSTSVFDALKLMTEKNISAVLIMDKQELIGIFTERDYARKIILLGKSSKETSISEAMTKMPITVQPTDSIELCMQIMTDKHIRHLPVKERDETIGMVSIGDVVKFIIAAQKQTISQLESYINS